MKRTIILISILLTMAGISRSSSIVAQGNTNSERGSYTIHKIAGFEMIKGDPLRAYEIWYENSCDSLIVAIDDSRRDITRFLVISDSLVIEYICKDRFFGASLVDERFREEGLSTETVNLDKREYYHQKLITQKAKTETEYLKLISVYFPRLLRGDENIYAEK